MTERLQKIISARGAASRRAAEKMIEDGRVSVNGRIARLGDSADPEADEIFIDGKLLPRQEKQIYLMLHKPRGFVTTLSDEKGRQTAAELVKDCGLRVYPVGRLDMDSEGLLLFTNDGDFANSMMHPKHEVDKTYLAWVVKYTDAALEAVKKPIVLDGYRIKPPQVRCVKAQADKALLQITIHEGRNRQVRRMCEAAGMHVTRLKRIAEGPIALGDLPLGAWRYLADEEITHLKTGK